LDSPARAWQILAKAAAKNQAPCCREIRNPFGHPERPMTGRLMPNALRDERCCVSDTFGHLYGILTPANLMKRFDEVDIEAIAPGSLSNKNLAAHFSMKGPLSYIGGKNRIADRIIEIFPKHTTYVEAFAGGAQVLFHKEPSQVEILNDLDGEVVNFFRVCQSHHEELLRYLRFILVSRRTFTQLKATNPEGLTDIQRAARYFYLLKNSFAGLVRNPNYHLSVAQPPSFNVTKLPELIEATHKRLARVQIESLPYQDVLQRYDRPTTLFYLDPPYFGRKLYRFNLSDKDYEELALRLRNLRGMFVLSLNDVPAVRKIFSKFRFQEIDLHYTSQRKAGKRYPELLITNFSPVRRKAN
jgi:DNA adenine methylase